MAGKNPSEAYRNFQDSLNRALGCITAGRLTVPRGPRFEADHEYPIALNRGDGVVLRGDHHLLFSVIQHFTIMKTQDPDRGPFKVRTKSYFYHIATQSREELLAYHWEPETSEGRTFPHLHVGLVSIAQDAPIPRERFHRLHIPTGRVSLESVIRLLIEEFGVVPQKDDWREILDDTEEAFMRYKTR